MTHLTDLTDLTDLNEPRHSPSDAAALDRADIPVDAFTRRVMNPTVAALVRWGLPMGGARLLTVVGRCSGTPRTTVVNLLELEGAQYLVAPRGHTQWVQNLRAAGSAEIGRGRRRRHRTVNAVELDAVADADETLTVLRAYLQRWGWQVRPLVDGARHDDPDDRLLTLARHIPAFRLTPIS